MCANSVRSPNSFVASALLVRIMDFSVIDVYGVCFLFRDLKVSGGVEVRAVERNRISHLFQKAMPFLSYEQ